MKTARLDTRVTEKQKQLYERAVTLGNYSSVTEFVTTAADKEALLIIQNHEELDLSKKDRKLFIEMLINPPQPNKNLKNAAKDYTRALS